MSGSATRLAGSHQALLDAWRRLACRHNTTGTSTPRPPAGEEEVISAWLSQNRQKSFNKE